MAPEVALDKPYNQAVDVYSFSMILWEMLHRKKPYVGMNVRMHRSKVSFSDSSVRVTDFICLIY